jgi:excinuclease UvrABC helicase subunit UvrB
LESVRKVDPTAEAPSIDVDAVVAEDAVADVIADLEAQMREAATALDFERAAQLRDKITRLHQAGDKKKAG